MAGPERGGIEDLLRAITDPANSIRSRYYKDPLGLAERLGVKVPEKPANVMIRLGLITREEAVERFGPLHPGLRQLVEEVCLGEVESAAVVANRGGGKSMGVSFIEFFLVFIRDFDALNLGGSELQADQVYQYVLGFINSEKEFEDMVLGDPLQSKTTTVNHAWIRVLTASSKSVRSPHAGGRKKSGRVAGGVLVIDEEAEAEADIVEASLATINTAQPSVNIRASTFHNAVGSFAELMDDYDEMGYKLYQWDIFDVAEPCSCPAGRCESEEKCFREDHVERYLDEEGEWQERLLHRAYCGGRARYASGWIPVKEIEKLWRRMKRNHASFEVEGMGSRPSTSGYVIRDRRSFTSSCTKKSGKQLYKPGWPVTIVVDWGTVAAGLEVWQEQAGDRHVLIEAEQIEEAGEPEIIAAIMSRVYQYKEDLTEVAADVGGGGNYLNPLLRESYGLPVRDVKFAQEKEAAAAAWNMYNGGGYCTYPKEAADFIRQAKKWRRKNGRIDKGDDHLCDAALCYFAKFTERLGLTNVRVLPRTFYSGQVPEEVRRERMDDRAAAGTGAGGPIMMSLFGRSRRGF